MVSKVALAIIGCLLLSNVASAAEEESQPNLRKLDVVVSKSLRVHMYLLKLKEAIVDISHYNQCLLLHPV